MPPHRQWRRVVVVVVVAGLLLLEPSSSPPRCRAQAASASSAAAAAAARSTSSSSSSSPIPPDCNAGGAGGGGGGGGGRYRALVCWLYNAKISLPDGHFRAELFAISVTGMTCTHFQVSSLESYSSPSSSPPPPGSGDGSSSADYRTDRPMSVSMDLRGTRATCSGRYDLGGMWGSGDVVASAGGGPDGGGPSLRLRVDVASGPLINNATADPRSHLPFPTTAALSSCEPNLLVTDLAFSGSISSRLIGLFSGTISGMITDAMNEKLCPLIKIGGESFADAGLSAARDYIGGLILNNTNNNDNDDNNNNNSETPPSALLRTTVVESSREGGGGGGHGMEDERRGGTGGVGWDEDAPFLKLALLGANDFVSRHLNEGIALGWLRKLGTWEGASDDCEDCGGFFRGLNGLANSLAGEEGGEAATLDVPVPDTFLNFRNNFTIELPPHGTIVLTARNLKVSGIDNFTDLSLLVPSGKNTLSSSIRSDTGFDFTVLFDLEVRPASNDGSSAFGGDTLNETFELRFNTSDAIFESSSSWELDPDVFGKLTVGSFLYGSYTMFDDNFNPLNCVLEALRSASVLDLRARLAIDAVRISPYPPASFYDISLEDNIDDLINVVIQLVLSEYPETATEAFSGLVRVPLRNIINDKLDDLIGDTKMMPLHCANVDNPTNKPVRPLRFDSTRAIVILNDIINADGTIGVVNEFIRCVNAAVDTKQLVSGHFFNFSFGELGIVMHDLRVENVDSVYELKLLEPDIDHYHLENSLGYGSCISANRPCNKTASFSFGMNLVHSRLGDLGNINVRMNMTNLKLQGGTELLYDMNYFPQLSIADLLSHPQCMSVPVTDFDFYGFNTTVDMLEVEVDVSLSGEHVSPHSFTYKTVDPIALASAISALTSNGANLLQNALGDQILQFIDEASVVCDTPANPRRSIDMAHSSGNAGLWTFLIILVFITFNAWLFLRGVKNDDQGGIVVNSEDEGVVVNSEVGEAPSDEQLRLNEPLLGNHDGMDEIFEVESPFRKFPLTSSTALMYDRSIHPGLKLGVPAVLALAFVLFLSSNLSIGASVDLLLTRADGSRITPVINIYSFSLGSTISEMAKAGVYLLMMLIVFCSGIWPYVKLVLMAACWVTSTRRLPPVRREKILYLLDSLGKFSLIDAYVLVLMMVAFRYNLEFEGVGALNVYVTPKYGFYSFLFATIVSLVSGHAVLFLHRRTMIPSIPVYSGRKESLSRHVFDDKRGRGLVRLTKRVRRTILAALFLTLILICVGVSLKSYHFKFNGAAGTALGDDRIRTFSLVTIGEQIPHSVQDSSSFGIYWIQTTYFFFALVMPIVCLMSMVALFLAPMTLKRQQKVFLIAEVANAWSAIEVFVIAIVASLLEISPFAESMVGEHCSLLNQILSGWSGGAGENDLHYCFDVKSSIDGSATVLIIGVILNSFLVSSLHRLAHHALWERIEREDRPGATEVENKTVRDCVLAHTFVSRLRKRPRLGRFMFEDVSFGPNSEYDLEFEDVVENEDPHTSNDFWSEWRKIVSVI